MPVPLVNLEELKQVVQVLDGIASSAIVDRALREASISRKMLDGGPGFVPYVLEAVFVEAVARSIGDPHLGLKIGEFFDYSAYRSYASYVLGAPDLGSALLRGQRAMPLIHPGSQIVFDRRNNHLIVGHNSNIQSVVGHRHLDEGAILVIGQVMKNFLGSDWRAEWTEMTGDLSNTHSTLEDKFGSPVWTNGAMPAVAVRIDDLNTPNPNPPRPEEDITLSELPLLMGVTVPRTTKDVVEQVFQIELASGELSVDRVARRLLLGRRTLQRALDSEGTSFREVREKFLLKRARALLSETDFEINSIARSLGYAEPNNFYRFFRKSTGLSPGEYRAARSTVD